MATIVTNEFRNAQMGAPTHSAFDFDGTDDIRIALVDADTTTPTATTVDYAEVSSAVHGGNVALTGEEISGTGTFDASDATISSVASGPADLEHLIVFKWDTSASISPIAIIYDSATTGLDLVPNGGDVNVTWNASGILQI